MKLCASRAFWLTAYPSQGHEMLFDAHARGFAALGIARRGVYDNMKTAVDKVSKGKGRVVNARFAVMCAHYLFDADFCNVASGWEKGIVEKNVQDSRRRVWIEATRRRWGSFEGKRSANPSFPMEMKLRTSSLGNRRTRRGDHGSTARTAVHGTGGGLPCLWHEGQDLGRGQWRTAGNAG